MQDDATLLLQIVVGPDVVIACEVMHLNTHVGQFRQLAQKAGKALGDDVFVFVPEVEHVAQQIDSGSFLLDAVEKTHQSSFLLSLMRNSQRP